MPRFTLVSVNHNLLFNIRHVSYFLQSLISFKPLPQIKILLTEFTVVYVKYCSIRSVYYLLNMINRVNRLTNNIVYGSWTSNVRKVPTITSILSWIHFLTLVPISLALVLISSSHLQLWYPKGLLSADSEFLFSPIQATYAAHLKIYI